MVRFFTRVATAGRRENEYAPPVELTERALGIGAPRPPVRAEPPAGLSSWIRLAARLVYDSRRDPQPAGARVMPVGTHQLMYRAGDFLIDLRLEWQNDSIQVNLIGQIVNEKQPDRLPTGLSAALTAGRERLAETICNQFGEFYLQYSPKRNRKLRLEISAPGTQIEVGLNPVETESDT